MIRIIRVIRVIGVIRTALSCKSLTMSTYAFVVKRFELSPVGVVFVEVGVKEGGHRGGP